VGLSLAGFAIWGLWTDSRDDAAAQAEYTELQQDMSELLVAESDTARLDMSRFARLNPDFAGWIIIDDTGIHYPIVRGADNDHYLHTTFLGEPNPAGAIFMDYRAVNGFDAPLTVLFGHNMRDGSMFAPLTAYLEMNLTAARPHITIITGQGEMLTYEIFHARMTDAWDDVYSLDFDDPATVAAHFAPTAPTGAQQFLVLSTCPPASNRPDRVLVYAALVE